MVFPWMPSTLMPITVRPRVNGRSKTLIAKSRSPASCPCGKQGSDTNQLPIGPLSCSQKMPQQRTVVSSLTSSSIARNSKRRNTYHIYISINATNAMAMGTDQPRARRRISAGNAPKKITLPHSAHRTLSDALTAMGSTKHGILNAHRGRQKESA